MEKEKIKEALIGYFEAEPEEKFTVQELADKLKMNKAKVSYHVDERSQ